VVARPTFRNILARYISVAIILGTVSNIKHIGGFQRNNFAFWTLHKGKGLRREKGSRRRRLYIWQVLISLQRNVFIINENDRSRHFQGPLRPRCWCADCFIYVSCPGDQGFFRCDHVPAQFYLCHVRQARCRSCYRKFVPDLL
jgi:hypothetical protein